MIKQSLVLAMGILACGTANAEGWNGKGEAGILLNSGNTESKTINIGLGLENKSGIWAQEIFIGMLNNESNDVETANSKKLDYIAKRDFNEKSYAFAGFNYLDNAFDGFTDQASVSAGYGYRAINSDDVKLELGLGLGYRDTADAIKDADGAETSESGLDKSSETAVAFLKYSNKISANTEFYDNFRVEGGSENTFMENELGLLVSMSEAYSLKASFIARRNSDSAPEAEATDTITSLSLVYNF